MFGDGIGLENLDPALRADPAILPAAERCLGQVRQTSVYRDGAALERIDETTLPLAVIRKNVSRQPEFEPVGSLEHSLFIGEGQDRRDGSKRLLVENGGFGRHIRQNRRSIKEAAPIKANSTGKDLRTSLPGIIDEVGNGFDTPLICKGAHIRGRVQAISDRQSGGDVGKASCEALGNAFLDEKA